MLLSCGFVVITTRHHGSSDVIEDNFQFACQFDVTWMSWRAPPVRVQRKVTRDREWPDGHETLMMYGQIRQKRNRLEERWQSGGETEAKFSGVEEDWLRRLAKKWVETSTDIQKTPWRTNQRIRLSQVATGPKDVKGTDRKWVKATIKELHRCWSLLDRMTSTRGQETGWSYLE